MTTTVWLNGKDAVLYLGVLSGKQVDGIEVALVELPGGERREVSLSEIAWEEAEETLALLAATTGIAYDTLVKAVREGRVIARRSGNAWLATPTAVRKAVETGAIRAAHWHEFQVGDKARYRPSSRNLGRAFPPDPVVIEEFREGGGAIIRGADGTKWAEYLMFLEKVPDSAP